MNDTKLQTWEISDYDSASKEVFQLGTYLLWSQGSCLCSPVFDIMVARCLSINKPATFHFDHINAVVKVYCVKSYSVWFWGVGVFVFGCFFFVCVKQTFLCCWSKCTGVSGLYMIQICAASFILSTLNCCSLSTVCQLLLSPWTLFSVPFLKVILAYCLCETENKEESLCAFMFPNLGLQLWSRFFTYLSLGC